MSCLDLFVKKEEEVKYLSKIKKFKNVNVKHLFVDVDMELDGDSIYGNFPNLNSVFYKCRKCSCIEKLEPTKYIVKKDNKLFLRKDYICMKCAFIEIKDIQTERYKDV